MRLSFRLQSIIKEAISFSFGNEMIYLFGSRTDESQRGGDIDIAIKTNISRHVFRIKRARAIAYLIRKGFDLKIDFVQLSEKTNSVILKEIETGGIRI